MTSTPEAYRESAALRRLRERRAPVWATPGLIGICALVYVVMALAGISPISGPTVPQLVQWGGNAGVLSLGQGQVWRMFTCMFVHIGIIHIGMNMYVLWLIGRFVEPLCGSWRYLVFYLVAGLCGSVASSLIHPRIVSAGASGAIFGLYGVVLGFALRHRRTLPPRVVTSLTRSGGTFVLYNIAFGMAVSGIDLSAHLGGLAGGFLLGLVALN